MEYVNNSPAPKRRQGMTSTAKDPSINLQPKKSGSYQVIQATPHTAAIEIDGLHDIFAINRVMLSKAAHERQLNAKKQNCYEQSKTELLAALKELQVVQSIQDEGSQLLPIDDGPSLTAPKDTDRVEQHAKNTLTANEKAKGGRQNMSSVDS